MTKKLEVSRYKPNFADPRVRKRVEAVLAFCRPMLLEKRARRISSKVLDKHFGAMSSRLSMRLRHKLLQQEDSYSVGKCPFSYSLKRDGYMEMAAAIGLEVGTTAQVAESLFGGIADGSEVITYKETTPGLRRYHPVQNLSKAIRAQVFKGWYDYDIEAAAPALVYGLAQEVHMRTSGEGKSTPYPKVAQLVEDRASVRSHVAQVAGVDLKVAKSIVTALFFGAKLIPHGRQAIFKLVGGDRSILQRLKDDPFLRAYRDDVSAMWKALLSSEEIVSLLEDFDGGDAKVRISENRRRMHLYLRLERMVMDAVVDELEKEGNTPVLIHDGFMLKRRADVRALEMAVLENTGLSIRLSETVIGAVALSEEDFQEFDVEELVELE